MLTKLFRVSSPLALLDGSLAALAPPRRKKKGGGGSLLLNSKLAPRARRKRFFPGALKVLESLPARFALITYVNELSFPAKNECVGLRVDGISRAVGARNAF